MEKIAHLGERLAQDDLVTLLDEIPGCKGITDQIARCEALVCLKVISLTSFLSSVGRLSMR